MSVARWPGTRFGPVIQIGRPMTDTPCEFEWDCAVWGGDIPDAIAYALWLDASDASTFTYGTTSPQIATWTDKSSYGRTFIRNNPPASADLQRNGSINGHTAVRSSGFFYEMNSQESDPQRLFDPVNHTDQMWFAVVQPANATRFSILRQSSGVAGQQMILDFRVATIYDAGNATTAHLAGTTAFVLGTPYLYAGYRSGSTMKVYRNGAELLSRSDASGSVSSSPTGDLYIFTNSACYADTGEIIIVPGYLAEQFTALQTALAAKWGITLAGAEELAEVEDPGRWGPWWDWQSVECDVAAGSNVVRGTSSPSQRPSSSTASLTLVPRDNTLAPWYVDPATGVRPNRGNLPLRVGVTDLVSGDEWWLFTGWVDYLTEVDSPDELSLTIVGSDGFKHLSNLDQEELAAQGAGEAAGARIARILDRAGWMNPRDLSLGTFALQATTLAQPALEEIFLVADTEAGGVWVDTAGAFRFVDRDWLRSKGEHVDWRIGDRTADPDAICASSIVSTADDMDVQNVIGISRVGGVASWVTDADSVAKYGRHSWSRFDLPYADDDDTGTILALQLADRTARDYHVQAVVLSPLSEPSAWDCCVAVELFDTVYITRQRGGELLAEAASVIGIDHSFGPGEFVTVLSLGPRIRQTLARWDVDVWDAAQWSGT